MNTFTTVKVLLKQRRVCEKLGLCLVKFPEDKKPFNVNATFKKFQFCRVFGDDEPRCERKTENKDRGTAYICHQKRVSFCYYIKFDFEYSLPTGCYPYFGNGCMEQFF